MTQSNIPIQADYADALLSAKRAKNILFVIILLLLLIELALFFVARYTKALAPSTSGRSWPELIQYLTGLIDFLGLILPAVLSVVLLLITAVLLVGRLLGAARLTSAFLWSVLLTMLLFPWQAMLNNPANSTNPVAAGLGLKIPGVLYTWTELSHATVGATFSASPMSAAVLLHWARYVVFPIISVLILLLIQFKSDRGLRQALGTDAVSAIEATPAADRV